MRELKDWELHENETQCGMVLSNRALIDEYALMSDSDPKTVSKYALFLDEFAEWLERPLLEAGRADVKRFLAYLKTDGRARLDQGRPEEERRGWRGNLAASTRQGYLAGTRVSWRHCADLDYTDREPRVRASATARGVPPKAHSRAPPPPRCSRTLFAERVGIALLRTPQTAVCPAVEPPLADLHECPSDGEKTIKPFLDDTLEFSQPQGLCGGELVSRSPYRISSCHPSILATRRTIAVRARPHDRFGARHAGSPCSLLREQL